MSFVCQDGVSLKRKIFIIQDFVRGRLFCQPGFGNKFMLKIGKCRKYKCFMLIVL